MHAVVHTLDPIAKCMNTFSPGFIKDSTNSRSKRTCDLFEQHICCVRINPTILYKSMFLSGDLGWEEGELVVDFRKYVSPTTNRHSHK